MTPGEQIRDFVYVEDVVNAYLAAGRAKAGFGGIFNIGSGVPSRIRDVAAMAASLLSGRELLEIGVKGYRAAEVMDYRVDISRAEKVLGWRPETDLETGLRLTIEAYGERSA